MPKLHPCLALVRAAVLLLPAIVVGCTSAQRGHEASSLMPPEPKREFRAAWVATVGNIDWPSKPGLSTVEQQQQILAILDTAKRLNMNAIVLQVRTSCDAFYPSKLEPWSEYLTGTQGKAPEPYYDPLEMWVTEAHRRGIELHAWFNPYRARAGGAEGETSPEHISKTNPAIVKSFNRWEWLDPGEPAAQDLTYNVFLDVVNRYDVDGIHIDDYFYPYKEYLTDKETKKVSDFPDDPSWARYQESGGTLSRDDWRRDNVNRLIERIYKGIKRIKPHMQFGISPFGIAKPGRPSTVKSTFSQYDTLYADAQLWWNKGWCDYYTPQLYWKVGSDQPYEDLVEWWANENTYGRHLWPGLFTSRVGDGSEKAFAVNDIIEQIYVTRDTAGATGHVHFSMKALQRDFGRRDSDGQGRGRGRRRRDGQTQPATQPATTQATTSPTTGPSRRERLGIAGVLAEGVYAEPALVPASPWLDKRPPASPTFDVKRRGDGDALQVSWKQRGKEPPRVWAIYAKHKSGWKTHVFPPDVTSATLPPDEVLGPVTAVAVRAVDRSGNQSPAARAKKPPEKN